MKKNKYVTIRDIAKEANVSINTVSRALNNKHDIKKETKQKIENIAKKLGYVRNTHATLLRGEKSKIIGVITPDSSNPFFSEVYKGIERKAEESSFQIIMMNSEGQYNNEEKAVSTLLERRVDGILMFPMQQKYNDINQLVKENFPIVIVGRKIEGWKVCEIYNDDSKGGFLATEHLIKNNCKNIFMITDNIYNTASKARINGFIQALNKYDLKYNEKNIIFCKNIHIGNHVEEGYKNCKKLLKENKDIDGIFCYNDLLAYGVIKALNEEKVKIPEKIKVVGFDDIKFSTLITPSLSTIKVQKEKLGEDAFALMMKILDEKIFDAEEQILDVELVVRNSTVKGANNNG